MGNRFTNRNAGDLSLKISNGGTDVLFDCLSLSCSSLARTDWEKLLAAWFAGHDQNLRGLGTVGFDIDDIGWIKDDFVSQKSFVMRCIDLAISEHRWSELSYRPGSMMYPKFTLFKRLVELYQMEYVTTDNVWGVSLTEDDMDFKICPDHNVYMHSAGCRFCTSFKVS